MALTATVQSALPTWDETIVPALRKRLASESRILAKRMSVASITSADDPQRSSAPSHSRDASHSIPEPRKSSAIPRPSLQHSRTTDARSDASSSYTPINGLSTSPSFTPKRARTYSQPPSPNAFSNNPLPTPDPSRPTSPRTSDVKPTRIPIAARTRTASGSSHAHSIAQRTESRNGVTHRPYPPDTSQDHLATKTSEPQPISPPTTSMRHQASSIMNEPPPFATPSIRSRRQDPVHFDPRTSTDSEERPFEHWYRGDVHRNGGVGELRVARHVEMLQIANYGHNLRKVVHGQARDLSGQVDSTRGRKRADSVGTGTRESLYLDDERTRDVSMVLDESPLTDLEGDPDIDPEVFYDAYASVGTELDPDDTIHSGLTTFTPGPSPAAVLTNRSETPTRATPVQDGNSASRHPAQVSFDPLRSGTPSAPPRTSAESTVATPRASGPRSRSMSSTTSPTSQSSDQSHTKRRAKSPAASSSASAPKKVKTKARSPPPTSRDPRNSVAKYPTPEGDMLNAIPTWTQPVQKSGNWDEVVLPVVARKRGLNGLYEQADGSPKPRSPEALFIKPAPGTFGYDYTKYRPPHRDEGMLMSEFGHIPEEEQISSPLETSPKPKSIPKPQPSPPVQLEQQQSIWSDPRKTTPNPPNSPAPFSHYRIDQQLPTINVTRPSSEFVDQRRHEQEDDDVTGGCCKCVVM